MIRLIKGGNTSEKKYRNKVAWVTPSLQIYTEPPELTPEELAPGRAILKEGGALRFDSKLEARRFVFLAGLRKQDVIAELQRQIRFPIKVNGVLVCTYVADFGYLWDNKFVVEDAKGKETELWKMKWKLVKALYPTIHWVVVKKKNVEALPLLEPL